MCNIKLTSSDKKEIKEYLYKHLGFNEEIGEYEYYKYNLLFLRDEWGEKCYHVAIMRLNEGCNKLDSKDVDFFFDVEEFDEKIENKIVKMINKELSKYNDIVINDVCKSKFCDC